MEKYVLTADGVTAGYGKQLALRNASIRLSMGEIVGVIGHNGSGKSTLTKVIAGIVKPRAGQIVYKDVDIGGRSTSVNVRDGIRLVPQGRGVLRYLTVNANLRLSAAYADALGESKQRINEVYDFFPNLAVRRDTVAGVLSGGQQRALSIAMGLVTRPQVLLIDEPSIGLSPALVSDVFSLIQKIPRAMGSSIIIVEQNVGELLRVAGRVYVMKAGETIGCRDTDELMNRESLMELY